jgi:nitroreductase
MNFMDVLQKRRAVREYTDEPMDRWEIDSLINAAIEAPSAMNVQPWAFAVVLGKEEVENYAKRAKESLLNKQVQFPDRGIEQRFEELVKLNPDFTLFYHAPALVLVLAKSSEHQAVEDCCLAAQNLMLAARDRDLGTCWIGFARPWLNLPEVKAELGLRSEYEVVAPIVLGYPTAWPESHGRKPPEIHWVSPVRSEEGAFVRTT